MEKFSSENIHLSENKSSRCRQLVHRPVKSGARTAITLPCWHVPRSPLPFFKACQLQQIPQLLRLNKMETKLLAKSERRDVLAHSEIRICAHFSKQLFIQQPGHCWCEPNLPNTADDGSSVLKSHSFLLQENHRNVKVGKRPLRI